uniref:Uncharacterized protein n=1 Tax=Meloidogyne incognita TaxID=6306 RepID=A0A914MQW5_MELIC
MYSFLSKYFNHDGFNKITKKLEAELEQVKVKAEFEDDYQNDIPKFPPVKRVIWFVRHGERIDNDKNEKKKARESKEQCYYSEDCNRKFKLDNSPLNKTGIKRAKILNKVFDNINIQHIFASPYERTLQTALLLLGESHKNFDSKGNLENELKIKVEPGFIENMIDCVNKPIGYEDINELAKHHSRLDIEYVPILNREDLARDYKEEESLESDIGCFNRVEYVLNQLLYNDKKQCLKNPFFNKSLVDQIEKGNYHSEWIQPGEESAEQILIVTHGMLLNAVHNHIAGMFTYAAQTSIVKIVELDPSRYIVIRGGPSLKKNTRTRFTRYEILKKIRERDKTRYEISQKIRDFTRYETRDTRLSPPLIVILSLY